MNDSIFSRVFVYRQRESNSPIENFLTEIFAFCLETDDKFRKDFFNELLKINILNYNIEISTQNEYSGYGRPDIELNFDKTSILFECKVEASERTNQLSDYASILINEKTKYTSKHIVFLTKYFEYKEFENSNVKLHLIRWFDVYKIINETHKDITLQLKQFLNENGMESIKNFTIQDMLAMKTIPETITKMDELLEMFKLEFKTKFGGYTKDSSRSTRLPDSLYINYVTLKYEKVSYWLLIGFFWWWDEEIPSVGLSIEIPKKKFETSDLIDILEEELKTNKGWEKSDDDLLYFSAMKPITEFISQDGDNIPAMKKYIDGELKTLYDLQKKYPKLFKI